MSEESTGSAQSNASGAAAVVNDDKVAYSTYSRVLSEAKKSKDRLEQLEKQLATEKESKLKEQNEWKTLAELKAKEAAELAEKLSERDRALQDGLKYEAFSRHLGGKLKHSSYANHIDFSKIVINPETGAIEENSVKSVVAEFVKDHAALVDFGSNGKLPNAAAKSAAVTGEKSVAEMSKEELEKQILEQWKLGKIK